MYIMLLLDFESFSKDMWESVESKGNTSIENIHLENIVHI
jgi:hypothetical protein